ncbi:uncharacterized protein LOC133723119 [Rosa rugosa]|uniref:uncharacterized protein LOC133723119 n=1 Tax=Rosa rugosa TaxID=74645 RepID=UPI002B41518B|nr:uncharacterized protein LOC133723119 [Rosa rugosa]
METLSGIAICPEAPQINHLLFADDSMLYAQASVEACNQIKDVLRIYEMACGQKVNFSKSIVTFSKNVTEALQGEIAELLNVVVVESHEIFLGLPTYVGRAKTATFQYIKERLGKKLEGWQGKCLTGAGKDILIRVVAQSLPTDLLKHGMRWQISNGAGLRVWMDLWLPNAYPFVSVPQLQGGGIYMNKVQQLFVPQDVALVKSLVLSERNLNDRRVWHLDSKGQFTVKSACKLCLGLQHAANGGGAAVISKVWKGVWQACIPGTARICIWKVLQNILPTVDRLVSKGVQIESYLCVLCGMGNESSDHLCRLCPFTKTLLESEEELKRVCYEERNHRVWEQVEAREGDVLFSLNARLTDFQFYRRSLSRIERGSCRWKPPAQGWLKVNMDGAFSSSSSSGGIGIVVRDAVGTCVGGFCQALEDVYSAKHVEALAGRAAVKFVRDKGSSPVVFETNSLTLANATKQAVIPHTSQLSRVYDDIIEGLNFIPGSMFKHAYRQANCVAHCLASFASLSRSSLVWENIPPNFILNVLSSDCNFV